MFWPEIKLGIGNRYALFYLNYFIWKIYILKKYNLLDENICRSNFWPITSFSDSNFYYQMSAILLESPIGTDFSSIWMLMAGIWKSAHFLMQCISIVPIAYVIFCVDQAQAEFQPNRYSQDLWYQLWTSTDEIFIINCPVSGFAITPSACLKVGQRILSRGAMRWEFGLPPRKGCSGIGYYVIAV